jgi:hypothetical protein
VATAKIESIKRLIKFLFSLLLENYYHTQYTCYAGFGFMVSEEVREWLRPPRYFTRRLQGACATVQEDITNLFWIRQANAGDFAGHALSAAAVSLRSAAAASGRLCRTATAITGGFL